MLLEQAKSYYRRSSVRNALYNAAETALLPLLWVIATPIFITRLGVEQYGLWMLVNALTGLGGGALGLGLADATIKFVSKYRALGQEQKVIQVIRGTITIYAVLGLVTGAVVFFSAELMATRLFNIAPGELALGILALQIAGLGMFIRFFDDVFRSVIYACERHDLNARITMVVQVATMIVNIVLVLLGYSLIAVLAVTFALLAAGVVVKATLTRRRFIPGLSLLPTWRLPETRSIVRFGFYAWMQSLLRLVQGNVDRFVIASLVSVGALSYYTVALRLAEIVHMVLARATSFIFPMVSRLIEAGELTHLRTIYNRATFVIVVLTGACITPLFLFGYSIFDVWMGEAFAMEATLVLYIILAKFMFHPLGIVNHQFLMGADLVRLNVLFMTVTAPIMIALMFLLIPQYGIAGAAMAKLVSIPSVILLRMVSEKQIFNRYNIVENFSYLMPSLLLLAAVVAVLAATDTLALNVYILLPTLAATGVVAALASFSVLRVFQSLRFIS